MATVWVQSLLIQKESMSQLSYSLKLLVAIQEGSKRVYFEVEQLCDVERYSLFSGVREHAGVVFFMPPEEEKDTEYFLSQFHSEPLDNTIVDLVGRSFLKWNASHGVDTDDAILPATAMQAVGRIYTLNDKHFYMPELNVLKA